MCPSEHVCGRHESGEEGNVAAWKTSCPSMDRGAQHILIITTDRREMLFLQMHVDIFIFPVLFPVYLIQYLLYMFKE